jgi:hypothetical protein
MGKEIVYGDRDAIGNIRKERFRGDAKDRFWDCLGYTLSQLIVVRGQIPPEYEFIYNYGSVFEEDIDFKDVDYYDSDRLLRQLYGMEVRKKIFDDVRKYAIEENVFNIERGVDRIFVLGPEIETLSKYWNFSRKDGCKFQFIGFPRDYVGVSFILGKTGDKNCDFDVCGQRQYGSDFIQLKEICDREGDMLERGQMKLMIQFSILVEDDDDVIYVGAYPGDGWERCLHLLFSGVRVLAIDPRYEEVKKHKKSIGSNLIYYVSDYLRSLEHLELLMLDCGFRRENREKRRLIFIWDVRRDYDDEVDIDGFINGQRDDLNLGMKIVLNLTADMSSIKVDTRLLKYAPFPDGVFFPQAYYSEYGKVSEVRFVTTKYNSVQTRNLDDMDIEKITKMLRKSASMGSESLVINSVFMKVVQLDFMKMKFTGKKVIAVCCLNNDTDQMQEDIDFMLSENDVFGLLRVGFGDVGDLVEYPNEKRYDPYYMNLNVRRGYSIIMPYEYSDRKYTYFLKDWRVMKCERLRETLERKSFRGDLYIGGLRHIMNAMESKEGKCFGEMYDLIRDNEAANKGFKSFRGGMNIDLKKMDFSQLMNYVSISGHMTRLIMLTGIIPVDLGAYVIFIGENFLQYQPGSVSRRFKDEMRRGGLKRKNDDIAFRSSNIFHSKKEWKLGRQVGEKLLYLYIREDGSKALAGVDRLIDEYIRRDVICGSEVWSCSKEIGKVIPCVQPESF